MTEGHSSLFDLIREYATHLAGRPGDARRRVLVVDDEASTRRFVDRVLRDAGFDTLLAADGLEGLAVARACHPVDIVVTDLMMPHMAGDELVRHLRTSEAGVKVLYLTGFSDRLFRDRPSLGDDEAYLDKPCSAAGLLQAISLLSGGRLTSSGGPQRSPESALARTA